jgi:hypothetical protein
MKHLFRLALLAPLALAGGATPAHAHGAFGLFYDRCNNCCTGCDKPWNAFTNGHAPANWYGQSGDPRQMPCLPYQGPGDPLARVYSDPHSHTGHYGCGDAGIGCGMGAGLGLDWKQHLKAKLHAFWSHCHHCKSPGCGEGCDMGFDTGSDAGLGLDWKQHLKAKLHAFWSHCHHCKSPGCGEDCDMGFDTGSDAGLFPGSCGANGCAPASVSPGPPVPHSAGYPTHLPVQYVPVQYVPAMPQYPGHAPSWGYGYPAYYPAPAGY